MKLKHSEIFKLYYAFMYSYSVTSNILPKYSGLKGYDSCFKFSRFMVQTSAQTAATVNEELLVFPQSFKARALRVPQITP
jgi:hypothetical protein